VSLNTQFWCL